jgi:hypothetical protein
MGFAAALLGGLGYALLTEECHPLLPFVTADTFALWVVVAVVVAELLKNIVYEPIVLGGAVHLHPIVVVIGVVGGGILFGPPGCSWRFRRSRSSRSSSPARPETSKRTG